ncbi:MAG: MBOAT family O-acyltransferase [Pirellulales bacterium]
MLFNSLTFLVFFAVVLALHGLHISWRARKFNLLVASCIFYAAWNPPYLLLIWFSTVVDWYAARFLHRATTLLGRRFWLCVSLSTNLGLLAFFKYGNFLLDNFISIVQHLGINYQPVRIDVLLPVGISFYTFQTLSYTIDVYRRRLEPWNSFLDFTLFVTFFPQLVAGPIVRAIDFLWQCATPRRANLDQLGWGLSLMCVGLFEKVVIADGMLAQVTEKVYDVGAPMGVADAWIGTLAFSSQIFCDFAGYSTTAIGVAMCLGFALPDNFHFPYAAIGFSDFWQRWHISLSSWLRDYLYFSLGGNRAGHVRTLQNLIITMFLGGLWHGAAWTFVVWGLLHGVYLVAERLIRLRFGGAAIWSTTPARVFLALLTFLLVCLAWVPFRAATFARAPKSSRPCLATPALTACS